MKKQLRKSCLILTIAYMAISTGISQPVGDDFQNRISIKASRVAGDFTDFPVLVNSNDMLTAPQATLYVNGVLGGTDNGRNITDNSSYGIRKGQWTIPFQIGKPGADSRFYDGKLEKQQLLNTTQTDAHILTEYNNQADPSSFYLTSAAPSASAITINTYENAGKNLTATDFTAVYSDADGDAFKGILITALPAKGKLSYAGMELTSSDISGIGYEVESSDISELSYIPEPDEIGIGYTSFDFKVFDGNEYSNNYTATVNVLTPVPGDVAADMLLWLCAGKFVYTDNAGYLAGSNASGDGAEVRSWKDCSGVMTNAATTEQLNTPPTYRSQAINYNPAIEFDGVDDAFDFGDEPIYADGEGLSAYMVLKPYDDDSKSNPPVFDEGYMADEGFGVSFGSDYLGMYSPTTHGGVGIETPITLEKVVYPVLVGAEYDFDTEQFLRVNGVELYSNNINVKLNSSTVAFSETHGGSYGPFTIGRTSKSKNLTGNGGRFFGGYMAELILIDENLTTTDRLKLESYLAIKYSTPIEKASSYQSSDGVTIWDGSVSGYQKDIFGLARDDASNLLQKQSHTQDDTMRIYIDNLAVSNPGNAGTISTDGAFLLLGHNGGKMHTTPSGNAGLPNNIYTNARIEREWKVTNTNFSESFSIDLKLSGTDDLTSIEDSCFCLLVDTDGDFSDATVYRKEVSITNNGGLITISGITPLQIPANSTNYITLAYEINDVPSFMVGSDQTINEDAGNQSVSWATGISQGPSNESDQTLTFTTTNNNNSLFSVQPTIDATGTLTYTPAADSSGTATVDVVLKDDGGTSNGGVDSTLHATFTITIASVNDAPSFTSGSNQTVLEDSGAQTVSTWATDIEKGPIDETGQTVAFSLSNDNNSLFSVQPAIDVSGNLTYTPATNAIGIASVDVVLKDDGGTANGGMDSTAHKTFTIAITSVNHAPSFTAGTNQSIQEDAGEQNVIAWASDIDKGAVNESWQTISFMLTNNNNSLFSEQPAIDASGNLTYTPAENKNGMATVSIELKDDGGTEGGGVDTYTTQVFTITVEPVNDAPTAEDILLEFDGFVTENICIDAFDIEGDELSVSTVEYQKSIYSYQTYEGEMCMDITPEMSVEVADTIVVNICDNGTPEMCATAFVILSQDFEDDLEFMNGISPDGDGENDLWLIKGIVRYPNNEVVIFDRWGNTVYKAHGYNNLDVAWDGQINKGLRVGGGVPNGTYFYIVKLGDKHTTRSGYIVVNY